MKYTGFFDWIITPLEKSTGTGSSDLDNIKYVHCDFLDLIYLFTRCKNRHSYLLRPCLLEPTLTSNRFMI